MLTGDLVRARVKGPDLLPSFVKVDAAARLERAAELLALFDEAAREGWTRGTLVAACRELEGTDPDHKVTKGFAKVLLDRCEFETVCPGDPAELRFAVFERAAAGGPLARRPGPTGRRTAASVLDAIAGEMGETDDGRTWDADSLGRALYADLKDEQQLTRFRGFDDATALLHRYNVALVQALLLKGIELTLRLRRPDPKRVRQLFRWMKFQQLMFRAEMSGDDLILKVDGPQSLLRQSTRYGLKLASFFPAILLQQGDWWMEAQVSWGRATRTGKRLQIDASAGLRSHLRDTGTWRSRAEVWFEERFEALDCGWTCGPGQLLDLGDQRVVVPDFTFEKGGRTAHLDIVGYWRTGYLDKRLKATPDHVLLAVSRRLIGDKSKAARAIPDRLADRVIPFAEIIPANEVLSRIEAVARPTPRGRAKAR